MEKYPEELCTKMREIYKLIIKRIMNEGKLEESDALFLHFFKTQIEQNTK